MKWILFLLFLFSISVYSQNYQSIEEVDAACAQLGFMGDEDAEIAVDRILDKVGLFKNFTIQECPDINNAVAKNIDIGNGKKERYILYDAEFFKRIDEKASNDWAAISVLAHEIGHHLNGHALNDEGSSHQFELEADEFSGFVLARMGASIGDAQSAINTLKYEKATKTHPAKSDRLVSIERGYNRGRDRVIEVKRISDDVKDVIVETVEDVNDIDGITAQQVIGNYIKAIGGQERIVAIKTMSRDSEMTTKTQVGDTKTTSSMTSNIRYLSPSKFISTTDMSTGQSVKSMYLDAKFYIQKTSGQWGMTENKAMAEFFEGGSYIAEYLYLVNNKELKFKGVEKIKGERYYVIELPPTITKMDLGTSKSVSTMVYTNYYNVETGLLDITHYDIISEIDYEENTEYLKDTTTKMSTELVYSDYREVGGVLFSFRQDTNTNMEITGSSYASEGVTIYTDIKVNPIINPADFTVEDKEVFNQDEQLKGIMEGSKYFSKGTNLVIKEECSEGIENIKKSAELGTGAAQVMLAELYDNSYFFCKKALKRDYDQALYWYTKAGEQGEQAALKKLAMIYEKGDYGVDKNKEKAYRYYVKSTRSLLWNMVDPAVLKSIEGLARGLDISDSEETYISALKRMKKGDKEGSKAALLQAANAGNADAQVALGYVYLMTQELDERAKWLKKAMEQGDGEAIKLLNQF